MILRMGSIVLMFLYFLGCRETGNPDFRASVDSISAASKNHYERSALAGEALMEAIRERTCSFTLATVNADGSPIAAVIIPGVADDGHLMFRMAANQSRTNLL